MLVALLSMASCSSDDDDNTQKPIIDPVEGLSGYIFVSSKFFKDSYYGEAAKLTVSNGDGLWSVYFQDPQWGNGTFQNVTIDAAHHTVEGTGTIEMANLHSGEVKTYNATIAGDVTNPTITAELGTMGTTVISFFAGPAPKACQLNSNYAGTNSVEVGGIYGPYDVNITCKITPNPDGTINIEVPEHVLNETAIGNLTLGKVTFKNLYYDEANNRFYREYGQLDKDLTMHFKAEGGSMNLDSDYPFTDNSEIEVKTTQNGIQVINRYQLGKMPFPIVATFNGKIASEK